MNHELLPPRIAIVMSDQWRRALLRAALRDVGYDAIGTREVRDMVMIRASLPDRGALRMIIVDHETLGAEDIEILLSQRERLGSPDVVLLARATGAPPSGPSHVVLTRPFTIDDIVQAVQHALPPMASLQHP